MGPVRSALRHLAGAPGFTAIAILSLTLGIGPTTAIFSLIDEVLLCSLPVAKPEPRPGRKGAPPSTGEADG